MWEPWHGFRTDFQLICSIKSAGRSDLSAYSADAIQLGVSPRRRRDRTTLGPRTGVRGIRSAHDWRPRGSSARHVLAVCQSLARYTRRRLSRGFSRQQIVNAEFLAENHLGGRPPAHDHGQMDRPELSARLGKQILQYRSSHCPRIRPGHLLRTMRRLAASQRNVVLQCSNDIIAPIEVGEYVHARLPNSDYRVLQATGHCPNLSAPDEVTAAIREFV